MRAIIQRVSQASVVIIEQNTQTIGNGLLVLLGIEEADTEEDVVWLAKKINGLRIFSDEKGLMNLALNDMEAEVLLISQFTLFAETKKGNRPGFSRAARPEKAIPLYESMIKQLNLLCHKTIKTGIFGADMKVAILNDGPVTIIIDSKNRE